MDFDKKYMTIFNFILEIIVHNCEIFYEQFGEDFIEKFEIKYRNKFKNIVLNKIKEGKLSEVLFKYFEFDEKQDEYGLHDIDSDLKCELDEICRELCNEIDVETRIIKNDIESSELNKLQKEKNEAEKLNSELKININNLKSEKEQNLLEIKKKNTLIENLNLDLIKYEDKIKQIKKTHKNEYDLLNLNFNETLLKLKEENDEKEKNIKYLKQMINICKKSKGEKVNEIDIAKENETLKTNILKLKEENNEKEKNIKHLKQMIDICKKSKEEKINEINQNCENKINLIKEKHEKLKIQIQNYENEIKKDKNE
ncbi:hypothetical protein, partial [Intestinibacter sp.]|uniref:hypothetical protein n=1 Tax=Intestinibacter sp. TaxID=1965304 RepID=UPI002A7D9906|nr:hypothetical protein [Intestinibacter sp.]